MLQSWDGPSELSQVEAKGQTLQHPQLYQEVPDVTHFTVSNFLSCMALLFPVTMCYSLPFCLPKCLALSKSPPERRHELGEAVPAAMGSSHWSTQQWGSSWEMGMMAIRRAVSEPHGIHSNHIQRCPSLCRNLKCFPPVCFIRVSVSAWLWGALHYLALPYLLLNSVSHHPLPALQCSKDYPRCKVCSVASLRSLPPTSTAHCHPHSGLQALASVVPPRAMSLPPSLLFFHTQSVSPAYS